ncbi:LAMI_0F15082g1_1 [Lachancea mirantina]|uniref:LAMI_0F15082g1_1 n=1 Tax=Lachancea mirantina TaxID=1230905 RepID=A0A1G4K476_9SACH|nr:LAMI_0F15082g1_1 [Lachancea mirantina]
MNTPETEAPARIEYELYSCVRCRKAKKKCSKEVPVCKNCAKGNAACVYPGRAARRTKREMEEARARGESLAGWKKKRTPLSEDGSLPEYEFAVLDKDKSTHEGAGTLALLGGGEKDAPHVLVAETLPQLKQQRSSSSSFLGLLSHGQESHHHRQGSHVVSSSDDGFTTPQGLLEHEIHGPESTPIRASTIQIETIASVFKGGRQTPLASSTSDGRIKEIERQLYDRFIAAYYKHNHRSYPLLNKIEFLNRVSTIRDFTSMDGLYEDTFIFQLYMVMAIGCTTLQRAGFISKEEESLSEHFAYLAMKKFCPVMHLQNTETIKCLLLLGIYSFFEPQGVSSWTLSGIIMRLTIGLGLHKALTKKKIQKMSLIEVEMRYRAFWSYYCLERLVATSLGRVSAIDDDDITVPLPTPLYAEEIDDIEVTKMMISLRRMGGRIYKQVHSGQASRMNLRMEDKQEIIKKLRDELDSLYEQERAKIRKSNESVLQKGQAASISFHSSDIWLAMRYAQLQIMLYRPSALIPKPPMESLSILGDFCLQALKQTYTLYKKKMQPLNWITLFRTLTICNTMLYCLCQWSIDLIESKIEIQQCVEILQHFGEKWVFAAKCADVFQTIGNAILDISLSNGQVPNMDKLTSELFGASNEYQDILDENDLDISWVDRLP